MTLFRTSSWWLLAPPLVGFLVALSSSVPTTTVAAFAVRPTITTLVSPAKHKHRPAELRGLAAASSEDDSDREPSFKTLKEPKAIRGDRYRNDNSTVPSVDDVWARLGVKPPIKASKETWQRAMKLHKKAIPLLHSTDRCQPPDSKLNLACMWWKGLSGNDPESPVFDDGLAHDLLPSGWRKIIKRPIRRFYPRLHHANVELRTAYLDARITEIAEALRPHDTTKIRLVCLGAGYDTRGIRMIERGIARKVIEVDLPEVVMAKNRLFQRLRRRRPRLEEDDSAIMPELVSLDLNDLPGFEAMLRSILLEEDRDDDSWHTVFVFEAVMIYLNESVPSALLATTSRFWKEHQMEGSLVFADRLENVPPGGDYEQGRRELEENGWTLTDWCLKPGLARHMGSASLSSSSSSSSSFSPP